MPILDATDGNRGGNVPLVMIDKQTDYKWVQQEQVEQGKLIIFEDI